MSGCQNVCPSKCQSVKMLVLQMGRRKMSGVEMSENRLRDCRIFACPAGSVEPAEWHEWPGRDRGAAAGAAG